MEAQYTEEWNHETNQYEKAELPVRGNGRPHLSECLLWSAPDMYCTCDDWSPEWTI